MEKKVKESKLKILAAGDLHGSSAIAQKLADKARKNNVDLVLLLGDIHGSSSNAKNLIAPFKKAGQKVVFVPGNWDTELESNFIRDMYDIKNLEEYPYLNYKDVGIVGIGNANFQMVLNEEKAIEKLRKNLDIVSKKDHLRKRILISHMHAGGTKAEFSGFEGSKSLRKAVKYFQPDLFLQAHIHEAEGIEEKIGKTRVINVGRTGKILEI